MLGRDSQPASRDAAPRLLAHGRAYLQFSFDHPELYDIMFIVRSPGDEIVKSMDWESGDRAYDLLKKNVRECLEAGYFEGQNVDALAFFLWSTMHGIASLHIRHRLVVLTMRQADEHTIVEGVMNLLREFIR